MMFAPLPPLPKHMTPLGWFALALLFVVGLIGLRRGMRSMPLWTGLGFVLGMFYGRGDVGAIVGIGVGVVLSLLAEKISARTR